MPRLAEWVGAAVQTPYTGWPRSIAAATELEKVLAARTAASAFPPPALQIVRAAGDAGTPGPAQNFSGAVRVVTRYQGDAPARIGGAAVQFEAGARTAWHTHPLGQTLYIASGTAWVQTEDGPIEVAHAGDVVWIPSQVRHWHGASPQGPMVHFAVAEASEGQVVQWMEKVSEESYRRGPRGAQGE